MKEQLWWSSAAHPGKTTTNIYSQNFQEKTQVFKKSCFMMLCCVLQYVVILETMTFFSLYVVGMNILLEDLFELVNNCV